MAYEGYDSIGYDEQYAEHAELRDAARENGDENRDERHEDAADVSADDQERDVAQRSEGWSEGAPACLAAVVFAQRKQHRLQDQARSQAQECRAGGDGAAVEHPAEHI